MKNKQDLLNKYNEAQRKRDEFLQSAQEEFFATLQELTQYAIDNKIVGENDLLPWNMCPDGEYQWQKDGLKRFP